MFSRDFARSPYSQVHPTVDLALNFHKKNTPLLSQFALINEGGSLLSFCTVLLYYIILTLEFDCLFSTFGSLKKYPKISGYLDRISKIWIMKKFDIQSIQVSMYPKKMDIHVSKYPCIQECMISKYPIIQVSKKNQYPRYPCIRIYEKSGIHSSLPIVYTYSNTLHIYKIVWICLSFGMQK